MLTTIIKSKFTYLLAIFYAFILAWWLVIQSQGLENNYLFNWSYGLIGLSSFIYALFISKRWGGYKSSIGKLVLFLGLGLFSQWLGLQIWTYYNLIAGVEVPYPSFADVGYFGLVPAYLTAAYLLARVCGTRFNLRSLQSKVVVVLIPLVSLSIAFFLFVRDIGFEESSIIRIFFDLAYPIGGILPVTIAVIVLMLASKKMSGGAMRSRVMLLVFAFMFQFMTEYIFLYRTGAGTYINGGFVDFLYATSYFIMGLSLISLSRVE